MTGHDRCLNIKNRFSVSGKGSRSHEVTDNLTSSGKMPEKFEFWFDMHFAASAMFGNCLWNISFKSFAFDLRNFRFKYRRRAEARMHLA